MAESVRVPVKFSSWAITKRAARLATASAQQGNPADARDGAGPRRIQTHAQPAAYRQSEYRNAPSGAVCRVVQVPHRPRRLQIVQLSYDKRDFPEYGSVP